jgi:hypothetical protein
MNLVLAILPLLWLIGCGRDLVIPPLAPTPVAFVRVVTLGERIEEVFGDGSAINPAEQHFYVTVPTNGTLVATLQWDPGLLGTLLMLSSGNVTFKPTRPDWSPVVARLPARAGERHLIVVSLYGADWLPQDPYVLTTTLEP